MKRICIAPANTDELNTLTPLIDDIREDGFLDLTVLSGTRVWDGGLDFSCRFMEQAPIHLTPSVCISPSLSSGKDHSLSTRYLAYSELLRQIQPDILLVSGISCDTFAAAMAGSLVLDIPVAHIRTGNPPERLFEQTFTYGISKLCNLHFTPSEMDRQRVIDFGEHPDRVYNVGALSVEAFQRQAVLPKEVFCAQMGLDPRDRFMLVNLSPDQALGSRNDALVNSIFEALSDTSLEAYKYIIPKAPDRGIGRLINQKIDAFAPKIPGRVIKPAQMSPMDTKGAIIYCSAMAGNSASAFIEGASAGTPAVNIGTRLKELSHPLSVINCAMEASGILSAVLKALSPEFSRSIQEMTPPFEKRGTAAAIKEMIQAFTRFDIVPKSYYPD